jgi:hypothetical protein
MAVGVIGTYHQAGKWHNRLEGELKVLSSHDSKSGAVEKGRMYALYYSARKKPPDSRTTVEHIIRNMDGTIGERTTYPRSEDPPEAKGMSERPPRSPHDWFVRLPEDAKRRLLGTPGGRVPVELIAAVTEAGGDTSSAWWLEARLAPGGRYLPAEYQDYLRATALHAAWRRAREEELAEPAKYVVVAPLDGHVGLPEKRVDASTGQRFRELDAAQNAAKNAYDDFVRARHTTGYTGPPIIH